MRVSPSRLTQTIPAIDLIPRDETNTLYSAFAQDEVALIPGTLSLTFGAKIETQQLHGRRGPAERAALLDTNQNVSRCGPP